MSRRDIAAGIAFFLGMAAFGALILYLNRAKWQAEVRREEQRHRVFQASQRMTAGLQRIEAARGVEGEVRRRYAREAVEHLSYVIETGPTADAHAGRAEAHLLLGDRAAARVDVLRGRELDPARDWSDLERKLGD